MNFKLFDFSRPEIISTFQKLFPFLNLVCLYRVRNRNWKVFVMFSIFCHVPASKITLLSFLQPFSPARPCRWTIQTPSVEKKQGNCETRTWDMSSCRATAKDFGSGRRMSVWLVSHSTSLRGHLQWSITREVLSPGPLWQQVLKMNFFAFICLLPPFGIFLAALFSYPLP